MPGIRQQSALLVWARRAVELFRFFRLCQKGLAAAGRSPVDRHVLAAPLHQVAVQAVVAGDKQPLGCGKNARRGQLALFLCTGQELVINGQ